MRKHVLSLFGQIYKFTSTILCAASTYHSLSTLGRVNVSIIVDSDGVKTAAIGENLNVGFCFCASSEETVVLRSLFASASLTTLTILFWRTTFRRGAVLFGEERRRLFLAAARMRSARVFS